MDTAQLEQLARLIRYYILIATSAAQSGHPTSSLSAVELMTAVMFGGFFNEDHLLFSKGHAAPLLYALYAAAGKLTEAELLTLRQFESPLEGHPSMRFPYTVAPTGSLGQGLGIGVGLALNDKYLDKNARLTYVLLGDSEMAEGSNYEAMALAAHYKLGNLVGIVDVNRLGQRGETMAGADGQWYARKAKTFGWRTYLIDDGHDYGQILPVLRDIHRQKSVGHKPIMIVAQTKKGKGVSLWEDQENWHSKQLNPEQLDTAIRELGLNDKLR